MNSRILVVFLLAAFGLHLAWELAVCDPFYVAKRFPMTIAGMLQVTLADVGLSGAIYAIARAGLRSHSWGRQLSVLPLVTMALVGTLLAVAIELHALASERWAYSQAMPLLPGLGVGALPVIQLGLLTVLSAWIGHKSSRSRAKECETHEA